jgi:peptidoglycan/LPS O-acetylase OafA/YrhL
LRIVPCFAFGCALHALWRSDRFPARLSGCGAALLGMATLGAIQFSAPDLVIVMLLGGLIFMLASLAKTGFEFAGQAVFVYLGEISYSTYMICIPWKILAINGAAKLFNIEGDKLPILIWVGIVAALIPLSAISYHIIESPCRERMKTWAAHWKQRRLALAGAA